MRRIKPVVKETILLGVLIFVFQVIIAQDKPEPGLRKTLIGNSGCSAYLPEDMPEFEVAFSEDSSYVYTSEAEIGDFVYGCIAVKFFSAFNDYLPADIENLLSAYMSFLETQFKITSAAGQGKGHSLEGFPEVKGIADFWEDDEDNQYAVMGWANKSNLGVMYIYRKGEQPPTGLTEAYFNGFRFSAD
jgi:hypothetical protein